MISIIICSVNSAVLERALTSIRNTIGVPFESIIIDNRPPYLGICDAYNQGAAKAKYDIFCFMHEDVSFETAGWGQKVIDHLHSKEIGLIGLAGGDIKSWVPSSWASLISASEISYIQHYKNGSVAERILRTSSPSDPSTLKEVVSIDGFWMCTRRDVFAKFQFDSRTFAGFHGYDIDFSLQVLQEYKIGVIFDVIVHHYSEGSFDRTWANNAIHVSDKWEKTLPRSVRNLPHKELLRQHWTSMNDFLDKLIELRYSLPQIIRYYLKYSIKKYFYWKHFLHFLKYIFQGYYKRKSLLNR